MRRASGVALAAVLTVATFGVAGAAAPQHGARDPEFSGDGRLLADFGGKLTREIARDLFVTSSGKIVMVAQLEKGENTTQWGVARFRANGQPDQGFSGNGRAVMSIGDEAVPRVVVPLGGGAVLVGGRSDESSALVVYRKDGERKKSFGDDGVAVDDLASGSEAITDLRVLAGGKILAAGTSATGGFVARYLATGELDPEFGEVGVVLSDPAFDGFALTTRAELDPQGRLLVIGRGQLDEESQIDPWAVARFDQAGEADAAFGGGDGFVETTFTNEYCCDVHTARDVEVQPDGAIVVVGSGYGFEIDVEYLTIARYTPEGELDQSFGDGGKRIVGHGLYTTGESIALGSGGKITVAGTSTWSYDPMLVARFRANGENDASFGETGLRTVYFPKRRGTAAYAVAQRDGRIVVAGLSPTNSDGPQQPMVPVARLFS